MRIGLPPAALALAVAGLIVLWLCYVESRRSEDSTTDAGGGRRHRRSRRRKQQQLPVEPSPLPPPPPPTKSFVETMVGSGFINQKKIGEFLRMKYEVSNLDDLIKKVDPTVVTTPAASAVESGETVWCED
jgi:hypothetical protein